MQLGNLSPNSARNSNIRMHIRKEPSRVLLNLRHTEPSTGIHTRRIVNNTRLERRLETTNADPLLWASLVGRVGESETRWTRGTTSRLVDVGGCVGCGLISCLTEVLEADVEADEVFLGVDAEVVVADGAL